MSSDSDDDCYGNVSEKLQKMKDKFQDDKTETMSFLDDSNELDEIVKNCGIPTKTTRKSNHKSSIEVPSCSVSDLPSVTVDNTAKTTSKRMTRSAARNSNVDVSKEVELPPARSKRRSDASNNSESAAPAPRGRRGRAPRNRGRSPRERDRGRGRPKRDKNTMYLAFIGHRINSINVDHTPASRNTWDSIPTYSVGNTEDYPDQSDNQALFSNENKNDVVVVEEEENNEDNEELSVKVYWQSSEFFKFTIRRYQKITQIFNYFAKKENVSHDKLLFTFNERILKPDDTPESIDYSIVKFIDGGIVSQGVSDLITRDEAKIKDGINIKFQCQNMKKPFEVTIRLDDKLSLAMMKCSEYFEKPLDKLRFEFDGDSISGKSTARELEFEGGECIDVRIIS